MTEDHPPPGRRSADRQAHWVKDWLPPLVLAISLVTAVVTAKNELEAQGRLNDRQTAQIEKLVDQIASITSAQIAQAGQIKGLEGNMLRAETLLDRVDTLLRSIDNRLARIEAGLRTDQGGPR